MNSIRFIIFFLLIIGCKSDKIEEIYFDLGDYKFNSEIEYYLKQTKDSGFAATDFSFVSEHKKIINSISLYSDTIKTINPEHWEAIKKQYAPQDAIEFILNKSKDHDFILINEAHYIPQHRNFVSRLLKGLSLNGYKYLALEGFGKVKKGRILNKRIEQKGHPTIHLGTYIKEPEFGNLIREAIELDYSFIGYDQGAGEEREMNGARNILNAIDEDGNKGKTLVLCGWDHIKEGETGNYWGYALAQRIKEYAGLDPLTINQTQYSEMQTTVLEDSLYQMTNFEQPTVMLDIKQESIDLERDKNWYDIFVFHPRTKYFKAVPNWILHTKKLKEFSLPNIEIDSPFKILLYEESDDIETAVPVYIKELAKLQTKIKMPVDESKEYKLVLTNKNRAYLIH